MNELTGNDRRKLSGIVRNVHNQLTVDAVLNGSSPGSVFADDAENPHSYFIKTPECNLIGGDARNEAFNEAVKTAIGYFDPVLCDSPEWHDPIPGLHPNRALKAYRRKHFLHVRTTEIFDPSDGARIEYAYPKDLPGIRYGNKEILLDWINIADAEKIADVPLAAIVVVNGAVASCSALDCIDGRRVEIGIKTVREYRRHGYGAFAVSALASKLSGLGISHIGWHCMETNAGSRKIAVKCGFEEKRTYEAFYPFPPIENDTDLSRDGWHELGFFFMEKGNASADQFWQAARCFAHAADKDKVFFCVRKLMEKNQIWFVDHIDECEEFRAFKDDADWIGLLENVGTNREG